MEGGVALKEGRVCPSYTLPAVISAWTERDSEQSSTPRGSGPGFGGESRGLTLSVRLVLTERAALPCSTADAGTDLVALLEMRGNRRSVDSDRSAPRRVISGNMAQRHHSRTVELLSFRPGLLADSRACDPRRIVIVIGMDPTETP